MSGFSLKRLGQLMEPEPGNANEAEGILNPAVTRGPDGMLYMFPRLVADRNYSRIGIARVVFDANGDPIKAERLGIALEPETEYELRPDGSGGCEDPRVSFVEPLNHYVMTYTALGPHGPRIALAVSKDLFHWKRLGLATFRPYEDIEFDGVDNKDGAIFPIAVPDPFGNPALALLHRPLFPGTTPEEKVGSESDEVRDIHRESIWISYRDMDIVNGDPSLLCHFTSHHRLASPVASWEKLKIGVGAPPLRTKLGWLLIYHGVHDGARPNENRSHLIYSAGVMVLAETDPTKILYRTPKPVLIPTSPGERIGTIGNVVFPTGTDRRNDLHLPDRIDVYYGMADDRIGVAKLELPGELPIHKVGDGSRAKDPLELGTTSKLEQVAK